MCIYIYIYEHTPHTHTYYAQLADMTNITKAISRARPLQQARITHTFLLKSAPAHTDINRISASTHTLKYRYRVVVMCPRIRRRSAPEPLCPLHANTGTTPFLDEREASCGDT